MCKKIVERDIGNQKLCHTTEWIWLVYFEVGGE